MARKKGSLFSRQSKAEQQTISFKVPKSVKDREADINRRLAAIDKELNFSLSEVSRQAALEAINDAEKEVEKLEKENQASEPATSRKTLEYSSESSQTEHQQYEEL
ncbi:hypothetical protein [Endozoicomonas sp. ONNA1]|uniref:hypothetical protein n=1 Tax=Endozoicomonas sp. ONNA1 TaxID=2828740 RepID=UPI002148BA2F|nr:hypothetical protein [Endozoicomonas sp. ONNA1]